MPGWFVRLTAMRTLLPSLALISIAAPLIASALDFSPHGGYPDVRPTTMAAPGIYLLTNEGVIDGYPDGLFRPNQTVNRAEFLKIAAGAVPGDLWDDLDITSYPRRACFPDVPAAAWFNQYVCWAKAQGIIEGNPDGLFHPERTVNLAEGVKMTVNLWKLELPVFAKAPDHWYEPYMIAGRDSGLLVNDLGSPEHPLSRADSARIVGAFLAWSEGELDAFRAAERGQPVKSSSSSSRSFSSAASTSSASSMSSSPQTSSSSSASSVRAVDLPARSHFLMLGERSPAIAGITVFPEHEAVLMRGATVTLERSIDSIDSMFVLDENGVELGRLTLDIFDSTDKTWKGTFPIEGAYRIPRREERMFAIEVRMKERNAGGGSDELVQVDEIEISAQGEDSGTMYTTHSNTIVFPKHQTAQARLTSVRNALSATDSLPVGTRQLVGGFTFEGTHIAGASLALTELEFQMSKSAGVTVSNFVLGAADTSFTASCSSTGDTVGCIVPSELGVIASDPRTLRLFADVSVTGASGYSLQISLNQPGNPNEIGAIRWSDGSGTFNWTEFSAPIARSTKFQ